MKQVVLLLTMSGLWMNVYFQGDLQSFNNQQERNKEIAYTASHDLSEPLRTISSFIKISEDKYQGKLDEKANKLLRFISDASGRMRSLIDAFLEYSNTGQEKEMTLVDCKKLVEEVQQDLEAKIEDTNATIQVDELPKVKGFETELSLLFQNLTSNGIKFNKPEVAPKIKISAKEEDGWTFIIEDNGIGIADEHQEKIFNIFQRLHTRTEYEGTGNGLAL